MSQQACTTPCLTLPVVAAAGSSEVRGGGGLGPDIWCRLRRFCRTHARIAGIVCCRSFDAQIAEQIELDRMQVRVLDPVWRECSGLP